MNRREFCKNSILAISAASITGTAIAENKSLPQGVTDGVRLIKDDKNREIVSIDFSEIVNGLESDRLDCEVVGEKGNVLIQLNPTREDFTINFPDGSIWKSHKNRKEITFKE